jgi:hypothetical protein
MAGKYDATYNGYYSIGMPGPGGMQGQLRYDGAGVVDYKDDKNWTFYGKDPKVTINSRYAGNHTLTKAIRWWGGKTRRNRKSKKSKKRKSRKTMRRRR